ncbi:hypothetical protein CQW23_22359 [Capsicum baccatum]|uniref:Ubiquitin-like protease family profile domain-containing protein n=1 Tax=Capsicum baccatum TaxID=33114 RepID=A0A2G2W0M8_CAPBA|nr:hypothetical protein CQW23_22359 [Capsicum baccatum]
MKKTKPDEKGEYSKISSPVSSDFESEEEKVEEIYMARVLPKFAPHLGCHTVNDIEHRIKSILTKNQYNILCNNRLFVVFMKKKNYVVQAQFERCITSLETKESTANAIVIRAKGINLHFNPREFAVVTNLNCVSNKDDFVFDEDLPNRFIEDYFGVESGRYNDYPWGSVAFEELAKSLNKSSENVDDFISKKVFDKLHNEVLQEMKFIRGLVSTRCDEIMNAISEIKVTEEINENQSASLMEVYNEDKDDVLNAKLIDSNIGEAHISYSQFSFSDEVLRSINLDFIKSNLKVEDESMNTGGAAEMTVTTSVEDESKAKHHWVLAVISFNDRCIYVYDSLSSAGHDAEVFVEVEKLAEAIPICLVACKFYEKKDIDITNHPNYKFYDKMNLFDVYVVEDLPQQPSGSLDCGLSMVKYAECLTFGDLVSPVDFDPNLIRMRYASIL